MKKWVNALIFAGSGVVLLAGILIFHYAILPMIIRNQVGKNLAINNGTEAWSRFVELPVPLYFSIYFFNLVNPEAYYNGEKPVVKEVGPWVYKETKSKVNIELDDKKDTVKFQEVSIFTFDEERSKPLKEDDFVQPAQPIAPIIYDIIERFPAVPWLGEVLELGFTEVLGEDYKMILNRTVNDILFRGIVCNCPKNGTLSGQLLCSALANFPNLKILSKLPDGNLQVAVVGFKNNTPSDVVEIYRGNNNIDDLGKIVSVNGKVSLNNWYGDECNSVAGTYAESVFKPLLTTSTTVRIFDGDICTSTPLSYLEEREDQDIPVYRFTASPSFLASVTDYPENYCYCPGSINNMTLAQGCLKKGVMEISACQAVPAIVSFPHFYQGSSDYQNLVDGLHPDVNKHLTYIDMEPTTGVPVSGAKRVQVNFRMKGTPTLRYTGKAPEALMPLMWLEESVTLGEKEITMLRDQLLKLLNIASIIRWVLIGAGSAMVVAGLVAAFFFKRQENRSVD